MNISSLTIIAGSGNYPFLTAREARRAGVGKIYAAAFEGETSPALADLVDGISWIRVGQLGRLLTALRNFGAPHAIMAGQIAPKNLFDLRPDFKTLTVLARLRTRNAETLFGALADELEKIGVTVLPATTFLEEHLSPEGHIAGPPLKARAIEDARYGIHIAKEVSRLDIGQTVVVRNGTVLAVEAFEGTNEAILRGGALGRSGAIMAKVSKPNQDMRFDVPVVGPITLDTAARARLRAIALEAGRTLLLDREELFQAASRYKITLYGIKP